MKRLNIALLLAFAVSVPAHAQPVAEQDEVITQRRAGNVRSLRDIEKNVLPNMEGMQYLGPEYDPVAMVYRLKFIRNGRVVFVDVNARNGDILRRR